METRPAGERLAGRYVLEEKVATGGMATVWRARDEVLARPVAVKILREDLAADDTFRDRFRGEAVAAARLSHPRIVSVYDTGGDGDTSFIVMELFEGPSLAELLRAGAMEPRRAAHIVSAVLEGLAHAHAEGLVHRDVKPGNILVGEDGQVKVTDFGVAKAAFDDRDLTSTGKVLGTVRYLSPEQVEGTPADARSDLYATGVVLYEAITGRPPFEAENDFATAMQRLSQDPMAPRAVRAGIPKALETVTMRALARNPEDRYQTAEDMRLDLVRTLGRNGDPATTEMRPVAPPPPSEPAEPEREPSMFRTWMLVPMIAILVAAALIAVGLLLGRLEIGGPLGVRAAEDGGGASNARLEFSSVTDFDPEGDQRENPDDVGLVADGNPDTVWTTEGYSQQDFGGLPKTGVGVLVDLGAARDVSRVTVVTPLPGWAFDIRAGDSPSPDAILGSAPVASLTAAESTDQTVDVRARYVLIWITELAPSEGKFRAAISELRLVGPEG